MNEFKMLIDGRLERGSHLTEVINPASEEIVALCPRATKDDLDRAIAAALAAFPGWAATPIEERQRCLIDVANAIEAEATELARLLTQEQGKPITEAMQEVMGTAGFFRYFSTVDLPVDVIEDSTRRRVEAHRKPLGVVAAIVPWNFPLLLMAFKLPPALLSGNTIVLKPAATTPLTSLHFGSLVAKIFPAGVVNVIADANDLGSAITAHPDIAKISFTGSTATGARVMAGAAETLKRVTLELGGNDPGIVLDDVDPKETATKLFDHAFANNGQVCIAIKRLYVHDKIYDDVCDELAALADAAVLGDGLEQGVRFGPLQNKAQRDKVLELIDDARSSGRIIAGGTAKDGPGYFVRPTIVRDIVDGTRLVNEEQFGPVLPVIRFSEPAEAIKRANASVYGLGASVWARDTARAYAIADQLEAGTVWINKHRDLAPHIPFGGVKQSGIGTELGRDGLDEFTQLKVINIAP